MTDHEKATFFLDGENEDVCYPNGYMLAIQNTMAQYDFKWIFEPSGVLDSGEVLFKVKVTNNSVMYWGRQCQSPNIEIAAISVLAEVYDYLVLRGDIK